MLLRVSLKLPHFPHQSPDRLLRLLQQPCQITHFLLVLSFTGLHYLLQQLDFTVKRLSLLQHLSAEIPLHLLSKACDRLLTSQVQSMFLTKLEDLV